MSANTIRETGRVVFGLVVVIACTFIVLNVGEKWRLVCARDSVGTRHMEVEKATGAFTWEDSKWFSQLNLTFPGGVLEFSASSQVFS